MQCHPWPNKYNKHHRMALSMPQAEGAKDRACFPFGLLLFQLPEGALWGQTAGVSSAFTTCKLWRSYSTSLSFSFLIFKTGLIKAPP